MGTLVIDNKSSMNLITHSICSADQRLSSIELSRIVDSKSSDKTSKQTTSPNRFNVSSSSNIIMNSVSKAPNDNIKSSFSKPGDISSLQNIEQNLSETAKQKISNILTDVEKLSDVEKLYLYLQLPDGTSNNDDNETKKKCINNLFGKKADTEVIQTYTWIQSHLEEDISVSIPKHEVYDEYRAYCDANKFEKLCVADFGKAMKHIFPQVKPRRLGQRGNSKYCYSGLRKKILVDAPELPVLDTSEYKYRNEERENNPKKNVLGDDIVWNVILEWVEKTFNRKFKNSVDFARHLIETQNIKTDLVNAFKSSECKNLLAKNVATKSSSAKKKDVCNNINKKVLDKKKLDTNNCKIVENKSNTHTSRSKFANTDILNKLTSSLNENDKSIKNDLDDVFPLPLKSVSKMPIPNNSTNLILISGTQTLPSENVSLSVCSSKVKYKPIQPKPINLQSNTFQEDGNVCFSGLSNVADKRRHSVSAIFPPDSNNSDINIKKEFDGFSELKISNSPVDSEKNYKRQMEEKDFQFMAKKRHIENISAQPTLIRMNDNKNNLSTLDSPDLKVNEIETEALYDYLITNVNSNSYDTVNSAESNSSSKESIVQIRKLLENHLTTPNVNSLNNENVSNFAKADSTNKACYSFDITLINSNNCATNKDNNVSNLANGQDTIPPSPNARRHAFSFQPISARTTPVIPENSSVDFNFNKANFNGNSANSNQYKQMATVSVGPSQPPSEASSPFVSPRNTPIPTGSISRSRNNSGQSSYSNYRQTPLQSFDSGVSSIASSPFISPQTTPIPGTRMRVMDNANISRNITRARHSSGPGGPINRSQISNIMLYNRSNSLSPMIGENPNLFHNQNFINSSLSLNTMNGTNVNNKMFNEDLMNKLNVVNQSSQAQPKDILNMGVDFHSEMNNNNNPVKLRQRHFSNPYGGVPTLVKSEETETFKALLSRSQSVPLHQMFESNMFDSSLESQLNDYTPNQSIDGVTILPVLESNTISKQFSAASVSNETFELPHVTTNSVIQANGMMASTLDDLLNNHDSIIQSGQDLIVSSVQLDQGITNSNNDSNQHTAVDELNVSSPLLITKSDSELNDLFISDTDVEHFSNLDDFRDCDNDFSNIALENTTNAYDDFIKFN